jgi:UDP-N-acetylmuramate dehydrogenase
MQIQKNISLQDYNTFGLASRAKYFATISSSEGLKTIIKDFDKEIPKLILGGGSNILFSQDFEGLILKNEILGIHTIKENQNHVYLRVGAGENWHEFTQYCVDNHWGGVENLSLIFGTVGAAPIQNIGAYGVELKDVFQSLEAINLETGEEQTFTHSECQFGYRNSVFKNEFKGKYFITHVVLKLDKKPKFNLSYGAISKVLEQKNIAKSDLTVRQLSDVIIEIRQSKLPDPKNIGNSGSFFKNPVISQTKFENLQKSFPKIVSYPAGNQLVKLAAGWLIESCGWKGKVVGNTGTYKNQALVLVNHGEAKGSEIKQLALDIQASVKKKFDVLIEMEVNVV